MIEKLETIKEYGWDSIIGEKAPNNMQLMIKINEIIDKVNELDYMQDLESSIVNKEE